MRFTAVATTTPVGEIRPRLPPHGNQIATPLAEETRDFQKAPGDFVSVLSYRCVCARRSFTTCRRSVHRRSEISPAEGRHSAPCCPAPGAESGEPRGAGTALGLDTEPHSTEPHLGIPPGEARARQLRAAGLPAGPESVQKRIKPHFSPTER